MIPPAWLEDARRRLESRIHKTPLIYDPDLNTYLKLENRQITGSFKIRGALNKVLAMESAALARGLVTASAGNHGQGAAVAASQAGASLTVFASDHAVPAKLEAMRSLGADVRLVPGGYADAEHTAIAYADQEGKTWISPYNDLEVIAGQGTLGSELLEQLPDPFGISAVVVPVGGGGLAAGIGAALRSLQPEPGQQRPRLIAVQSEASPFFYQLYRRGSQDGVVELDSLADGLAGAVEPGSQTITLVRELVDEFVLVSEEQIARAIAYAWQRYDEKIEGSAAAALAAVLFGQVPDRPAVVVISGGNIQPEVHAAVCARWAQAGDKQESAR
jgi:threonine dehydratase